MYQWRNGTPDESAGPLIWYHDFPNLDSTLKDYTELTGTFSWSSWHPSWFPIFRFEREYYFVACSKKAHKALPLRHYFIEETETYPAYVNLTAMMVTAAELFEPGTIKVINERGALDGDIREIRRIYEKHNPGMRFPYQWETRKGTIPLPTGWRLRV